MTMLKAYRQIGITCLTSVALLAGIIGCNQADSKSTTSASSTTAAESEKPADAAPAATENAAEPDEAEKADATPPAASTTPDSDEESVRAEGLKKLEAMKNEHAQETPAAPGELAQKLDGMAKASAAKRSEETKTIMQDGRDAITESGMLDKIVGKGDTAPDFELSSTTDETIKLSDLLAKGPVVMLFYRGGWCPYCNATLKAYNDEAEKFSAAGATLIALTPELPEKAAATAARHKLTFPVLSDVGNKVAAEYGLVFKLTPELAKLYAGFFDITAYNGDDSQTLPLAATYVIDAKGKVQYVFAEADYRKRAEPADVLKEVQKLSPAAE